MGAYFLTSHIISTRALNFKKDTDRVVAIDCRTIVFFIILVIIILYHLFTIERLNTKHFQAFFCFIFANFLLFYYHFLQILWTQNFLKYKSLRNFFIKI